MIRNNVDVNFRDFLERREKELTEQIAEATRRTIPYEAELQEIRRAKDVLAAGAQIAGNELRRYLNDREGELKTLIDNTHGPIDSVYNELAELKKVKQSIGLEPSKVLRAGDRFGGRFAGWESVPGAVEIPYQSMTINDLVVKALKEHFINGAPIGTMLEFFRDKWGREIDKGSLSPQLSRLFGRGVVGRIRSLQYWFLIQPELRIAGQRPYLHSGVIRWLDKEQATHEHEPLITRDIDGRDDRMPYIRRTTDRIPSGTKGVEKLLWLLPNEVQANDHQALRHEVPEVAEPDDRLAYRVIATDGRFKVGEILWLRSGEAADLQQHTDTVLEAID